MPTQTHTTAITALFSNGNNIWDLASREQMHAVLAGQEGLFYGTVGTGKSIGTLAPFLAELRAQEDHQERLELFHLLGESSRGMSLEPHFAALKRTSRLQGHLLGLVQKRRRP